MAISVSGVEQVEIKGSTSATATATIAASAALSDAVDLEAQVLVGIIMPAAWTAADLTFQGSQDGTNFFDLYLGAEYTLATAASRFVKIPSVGDFFGINHLKVRSGTSGTPVNQAAERALTLVLKPAAA